MNRRPSRCWPRWLPGRRPCWSRRLGVRTGGTRDRSAARRAGRPKADAALAERTAPTPARRPGTRSPCLQLQGPTPPAPRTSATPAPTKGIRVYGGDVVVHTDARGRLRRHLQQPRVHPSHCQHLAGGVRRPRRKRCGQAGRPGRVSPGRPPAARRPSSWSTPPAGSGGWPGRASSTGWAAGRADALAAARRHRRELTNTVLGSWDDDRDGRRYRQDPLQRQRLHRHHAVERQHLPPE